MKSRAGMNLGELASFQNPHLRPRVSQNCFLIKGLRPFSLSRASEKATERDEQPHPYAPLLQINYFLLPVGSGATGATDTPQEMNFPVF